MDKKNHAITSYKLLYKYFNYSMKSFLESKRSKAIFTIGIVAVSIGLISKKVISYPAGGCIKGTQELTFNKKINKYFF